MAGKRITREAHATIEKAGGEEFILVQVAGGRTLKDLAQELGISRPILSAWCNAEPRRDAYRSARRAAANALVEEGLEIADQVKDPSQVPAAKLKSDYRRWMASRMNPDNWGEARTPMISISAENLHIEALTKRVKGAEVEPQTPGNIIDVEASEPEDWLD